jgi:hypothetical protein
MNSREYAKFKRLFVGPIMPRRIIKQRFYKVQPKPLEVREFLEKGDPRLSWDRNDMKFFAMPNWANTDAIEKLYTAARKLTEETGIQYHVDHIIPIKHPKVCGLHVEQNLCILSATDNIKKSNKFKIE